MSRPKIHTNAMNIRLASLLIEWLDELSSDRGMTRTEYIRFLIQREMEIKKSK